MKLFTITTLIAGSGTVLAGLWDMQIDFPFPVVRVPVVFPRASTQNLQEFTGALGGAAADPVTATGDATRPFECGGDTFTTYSAAQTRSCNNQHNACADIANNKSENTDGITTSQCDAQQTSCLTFTTPASATSAAAEATTTSTGAQVLKSEDANFFYFCDT